MIQKVFNKLSSHVKRMSRITFLQKRDFGYALGDPHEDHIAISTIELFRNKTNENPNSIALNSYDQNITFTYQQLLAKS